MHNTRMIRRKCQQARVQNKTGKDKTQQMMVKNNGPLKVSHETGEHNRITSHCYVRDRDKPKEHVLAKVNISEQN